MEKTAVLWVMDKLSTLNGLKELGGIDDYEYFHRLKEIEQKGLTMEKKQIMDAYLIDGYTDLTNDYWRIEFEEYYNETFKSE
jgi:hypothetical protein